MKKFLFPATIPLLLGLALNFSACGDDSTSSNADNPADPGQTDPGQTDPGQTDPGQTDPGQTDPGQTDPATPFVSPVALPSTANAAMPGNIYASWKSYHFVTMETESTYYVDIAADFTKDVFTAEYVPAGRVVWSNQGSTGYKDHCSDDGTLDPSMKFRACTVSEGIGYGMLLAYFNDDSDTFIRLWNYSRGFRAYNKIRLTPWITRSFSWEDVDLSSATDADLDIATALILMYYKTKNQAFLDDAVSIASAIWDLEINPENLLIYSGDQNIWKLNNPVYNLSYFSPVALRLFAVVDPSHNWQGVLDAMYVYMDKVQTAGTGVFPDWSDGTGVAANPPNNSAGRNEKTYTWHTFNKESVRIPWRIAWDYYWYQDERALKVLSKLNEFIVAKSGNDPSNIDALSTSYSWDPAKADKPGTGGVVSANWLGAWCATGMGTNAGWLDACTNLLNTTKESVNLPTSYFSDILLGLYSSMLNGGFQRPY